MTSDEKLPYTLKIEGPILNVEMSIGVDMAQRLLGLALGMKQPGTTQADMCAADGQLAEPGGSPIAPREFLDKCGAQRNPDKIAALLAYAEQERGRKELGREEIKQLFQEAGEPTPANLPRDVQAAVRAGWIAAVPGRENAFYLVNRGRSAIKAGFSKDVLKPIARRPRRRMKVQERATEEG